MKPGEFVVDDGEVIFHADDCCVAMGVAVLDRFVGGATAVVVERDGDGGYTVADQYEPACDDALAAEIDLVRATRDEFARQCASKDAKIEQLRTVVDAAQEGCDACHKYNGDDYCCDCYHAGSGTYDALVALGKEDK